MPYREEIGIYCEKHTEQMISCVTKAEFINVMAGGKYSYQWALKGKVNSSYDSLYSVFHNECHNFKTLYFCNHESQMNETCTT